MKRGLKIVALCLGLYVGYFYYSLVTGEARVAALCQDIKAGMTLEELRRFAEDNGFNSPSRNLTDTAPSTYLSERRSMGRHLCEIQLEKGKVKAARYQPNP